MLGGEPHRRPGMQHMRWGQPALRELTHAFPVHSVALAASPQLREPQTNQPCPKGLQAFEVARYRVVVEVALHDRPEPLARFHDPIVPALPELLLQFLQLLPQSLADRLAL